MPSGLSSALPRARNGLGWRGLKRERSLTVRFSARRIWRDYFAAVDAIVFMVDATDRGRYQEAREELTVRQERCLQRGHPGKLSPLLGLFGVSWWFVASLQHLLETQELAHVPFVVLGNKIDKPQAASEEELRQQLGLFAHVTFGRDVRNASLTPTLGAALPQKRPLRVTGCMYRGSPFPACVLWSFSCVLSSNAWAMQTVGKMQNGPASLRWHFEEF